MLPQECSLPLNFSGHENPVQCYALVATKGRLFHARFLVVTRVWCSCLVFSRHKSVVFMLGFSRHKRVVFMLGLSRHKRVVFMLGFSRHKRVVFMLGFSRHKRAVFSCLVLVTTGAV